MGMVGYYQEFIKGMAEISEPLNRLRCEGQPFVWTGDCQKAFESLRTCLVEPLVLIFSDWREPIYLEADASHVSVGETLAQRDKTTGLLKPIGYFSNSLDKHQRNYAPREQEAWGLVAAIRKWRPYCRAASKIYLVADHDSLKWLRTQPDPRGKFGWWLIELEELNYEITPRNGLDHVVSDCMSRSQYSEDNEEIQDNEHFLENRIFAVNAILKNEWIKRIKTEQEIDSAISFAINQIKNSKVITNGRFKLRD